MGEKTAISWTDHTFNPWWGCAKVSAECTNCYAETFDKRVGGEHWGVNAERRFFGDKHWREPLKWNAVAEAETIERRKLFPDAPAVRRRVFCASMADVFEERPELDYWRGRLWELIRATPALDWLLLTKRPEGAARLLPWMFPANEAHGRRDQPYPNVWLGTTCGVRDSLPRALLLRRIPAAVRFISCEPLLEHIPANAWDAALAPRILDDDESERASRGLRVTSGIFSVPGIHWLIVGNESGPKRRPAQLDWVRTAREAAFRHGVAFHFKQWVESNGRKIHLPVLDGRQHAAFPEVP